MATGFKGTPGTTYGFTDEDGRQVTRRANNDGVVNASNDFEKAHFTALGLSPAETSSSTKSTKKGSSKKSSAPKAPRRAEGMTPAERKATLPSGAPVDTSTDDAVKASEEEK